MAFWSIKPPFTQNAFLHLNQLDGAQWNGTEHRGSQDTLFTVELSLNLTQCLKQSKIKINGKTWQRPIYQSDTCDNYWNIVQLDCKNMPYVDSPLLFSDNESYFCTSIAQVFWLQLKSWWSCWDWEIWIVGIYNVLQMKIIYPIT